MKKIYLLLMGIIALSCFHTVSAQTVLLSEDFSGGIPAGWTTSGVGGTWTSYAVNPLSGLTLATTTVANGYAIFNSDTSGNDGIAENADLITSSFSCAGQATVILTLEDVFAQFAASTGVIAVSANNGPWVDVYTVGPGLAQNAINGNPNVVNINISAQAGNQADVRLRFKYQGDWDYWWVIDDLEVFAPAAFDAAVTANFISEYTSVPLSQVGAYTPSCEVTNAGGATMNGISVATTITNSANATVFTSTMTEPSIAAGANATLTSATTWTPSAVDFYLIEYLVSITEADGNAINDTSYTAIDITDSLYTRDFAALVGNAAITNALGIGNPGTAIFGNVFDITSATDLVSIEAFLNNSVVPGDTVNARLFNFAANTVGAQVAMQQQIITAADTPVFFMDFVFNQSLPTGQYFMSIEETTTTDNIGILFANAIYTTDRIIGNINGGAFGDFATVTGIAEVPLIRANLYTPPAAACSITDVSAGAQTACVPATNTYTQQVTVTYANPPGSGMLSVNGQTFAIGTSPQTVTLTGLTSNGAAVNVTAQFTAETSCTYTENAVFTAPTACNLCNISDLSAGTQTACVNTTNEYTQQVTVTYVNPPGSGMLSVNGQTFAIGTSPQTVTLTGLDSDGSAVNVTAFFTAETACTYTENSLFTAPASCLCPTITVNVGTTANSNCASPNGTATANVTGGGAITSYAWTPSSFGATQTISNLPSGTYSVTVTDASGCTGTGSGAVSNTSGVNALVGSTSNVSCNGGSDGAITITPSGGTAPISYTWSHETFASASGTRSNLTAGSYTVVVADAGGCSVTLGPIVITQPDALTATLGSQDNISCNGLLDGAIDMNIAGGTPNYSYSWSNSSATTQDLANLGAGTYQLTVTDSENCMTTGPSVTISQPAALTLTTSGVTNVTCNGAANGSFVANAMGGTAPYMYSTNGGASQASSNFTGLSGNTYTASVTDDNGCTASAAPISITEPAAIVVTVDASNNVSCNGLNDGSIDVSVTGAQGNVIYNWGAGNPATEDLDNLSPSTYQLTVTDGNSCSASSSLITITEPAALTAVTSATQESTSGASDGSASVVAAGGTAPYSYLWNDAAAQTTATASNLNQGNYMVTVTDDNGCVITEDQTVTVGTSIKDLDLNAFKVYPNPTSKEVTISFELNNAKETTIKFYNTIGKVILTDVSSLSNVYNRTFNVSDFTTGVYFIEISNEDGTSIQKLTVRK